MLNTTFMRYMRIFCGACFFLSLILISMPAHAAGELSVTPVLVDEKAKPREILKESLTIVNTSNRKLSLYPSVTDVDSEEGDQGFTMAQNSDERSTSLANWIELSRGVVELGPGEEKTIPFVIRVHLSAVPAIYHSQISFYEGSTRRDAEQGPSYANVLVNVEVQADIKEVLQLNKFFTGNIFFSGDDVLFNYQIENIGNQDLQPKGEIRIYDRKGKEVASVNVNNDAKKISPDEVSQLASVWSAASGFGRYKAFINVDFGASQKASVQDTVYFWIIPWQQLVGLLAAGLIAIIFLALYFHKWFDAKYHARYAHAIAHAEAANSIGTTEKSARRWIPRMPKISFPKREKRQTIADLVKSETPRENMLARSTLKDRLQASTPAIEKAASPIHRGAHAIDLKNLHEAKPHTVKSHHVINLKDTHENA